MNMGDPRQKKHSESDFYRKAYESGYNLSTEWVFGPLIQRKPSAAGLWLPRGIWPFVCCCMYSCADMRQPLPCSSYSGIFGQSSRKMLRCFISLQ